MTRFADWLRGFFSHEEDDDSDIPFRPPGARVLPKSNQQKVKTRSRDDVEFSSDVGGRIIDGGPGKNVLIRNKYVREDTGTHETLKIIDDSILDSDDEIGADPYNTGRFDRSKSWGSRK